jgi:hypothetical protein
MRFYTAMVAAGGAGGSHFDNLIGTLRGKPGTTAKTTVNRPFWPYLPNDVEFGPPSTPGIAFPTLPVDPLQASRAHLLIGGSGGGGGGVHPFYSFFSVGVTWSPGAGGGGGGGAIALRSGGDLRVETAASIEARGGSAPDITASTLTPPIPAPGGGGSGGTVLLQYGGAASPSILGTIDALGGKGGKMTDTLLLMVASDGGDGGAGYVRVESPTVLDWRTISGLKPAASADNVGALRAVDHDPMTAALTKWYDTGRLPIYHYYVVHAIVGATLVVFSDNPKISARRAELGQPVILALQSARIDRYGVPLDAPTPWAQGSIDAVNDSPNKGNGFRFLLHLDRSKATGVLVTRVEIVVD